MKRFLVFSYLVVAAGLLLIAYTVVATKTDSQSMEMYQKEQQLMAKIRHESASLTTEMLLVIHNVIPDFSAVDRHVVMMRKHLARLASFEKQENGRQEGEESGVQPLIAVMERKLQLIKGYKHAYSHMRSARDHMIAGIDNLKRMLPLEHASQADELLGHVLEYLI
ncbi:MAG: hypothetical protein R8J85_10570, partial [Mariprofundales bacterium]